MTDQERVSFLEEKAKMLEAQLNLMREILAVKDQLIAELRMRPLSGLIINPLSVPMNPQPMFPYIDPGITPVNPFVPPYIVTSDSTTGKVTGQTLFTN